MKTRVEKMVAGVVAAAGATIAGLIVAAGVEVREVRRIDVMTMKIERERSWKIYGVRCGQSLSVADTPVSFALGRVDLRTGISGREAFWERRKSWLSVRGLFRRTGSEVSLHRAKGSRLLEVARDLDIVEDLEKDGAGALSRLRHAIGQAGYDTSDGPSPRNDQDSRSESQR